MEERKELRPHLGRQRVLLSHPCLWVVSPPLVGEQIGWGERCQVTWLSDGANLGPKPGLSSNSQGWGPEGEVGCCGVLGEGKVGRAR